MNLVKVVALAGGTGSAKLLRGLSVIGVDLTVIANVGDNYWTHGLYVCPDIDIAMYTLAGVASKKKGWGIEGDTFRTLAQLGLMGESTWFSLGDRDIATHLVRTELLREGVSLTEATEKLRKAYGVSQRLLPVTDDSVETRVLTSRGTMHLQEFWVRERGDPAVRGVKYTGASDAVPTKQVEEAIGTADRIVVCPANPVSSIGPMLAAPGFLEMLASAPARITSLSPMIGQEPISGPAGKLMKAMGMRTDSVGVAEAYSGFIDSLIIDRRDRRVATDIRELGVSCRSSDIVMRGRRDEIRLARELLAA